MHGMLIQKRTVRKNRLPRVAETSPKQIHQARVPEAGPSVAGLHKEVLRLQEMIAAIGEAAAQTILEAQQDEEPDVRRLKG